MVVNCEEVWREISNYLEGELDPVLRTAMEEHFRGCKRCTAVLDGTRNVIQLYGDERMFEAPLGFGHRLHRRLEGNMAPARRTFLGWMVAAAAAVFVVGGFEIGRLSGIAPAIRSALAQHAKAVPPDMLVAVEGDGKVFHASAECRFIHDKSKVRMLVAHEALRQGYTPCVRCMRKYLAEGASDRTDNAAEDLADS